MKKFPLASYLDMALDYRIVEEDEDMIDKYDIEDIVREQLRAQPCFVRVDANDIGVVEVNGKLDLSKLCDYLWEKMPPFKPNY